VKSIDLDHKRLNQIKREMERFYPIKELSNELDFLVEESFLDYVFKLHKHRDCTLPATLPKRDLRFFQKFFGEYETALEKKKAREFILHMCDEHDCLVETDMLSRTVNYAAVEGRMAKIGKDDRVLIIGSGPFPETAICYAKVFGCKITGIDNDIEAVRLSRKVVKKLGLSKQIQILHKADNQIAKEGFTKVLVTILSQPKARIIKGLEGYDSDIIVRTVVGLNELVYEKVDPKLLRGFDVIDSLTRWNKNINSSLLIRSK